MRQSSYTTCRQAPGHRQARPPAPAGLQPVTLQPLVRCRRLPPRLPPPQLLLSASLSGGAGVRWPGEHQGPLEPLRHPTPPPLGFGEAQRRQSTRSTCVKRHQSEDVTVPH